METGSSESSESAAASLAEDFLGALLAGRAFWPIGGGEFFASFSCFNLRHSETSCPFHLQWVHFFLSLLSAFPLFLAALAKKVTAVEPDARTRQLSSREIWAMTLLMDRSS